MNKMGLGEMDSRSVSKGKFIKDMSHVIVNSPIELGWCPHGTA
ncbi:hypothetical protein KNP414_01162 [Paenibacillus mucilaginosus KNP414]|uniref:Uncharacterized protein n=1 Tax=Paenibacillus mucilaginosus (strain KNP414) TaxID=1036673 RepID=F8FF29_PAEMK|nr:hypothetical protein KNP414_01162 [Paenibacillus mucilaginosus KNP414]